MRADDARANLTALERVYRRRRPTPGVRRWFLVLPDEEPELVRPFDDRQTMRIRIPRIPDHSS